MKNEFLTFAQHLLGAGITALYQGTILVLLVWLGLRTLPRTNAATRHAVWFCTLLMVASILVVHGLLKPLSAPPDTLATRDMADREIAKAQSHPSLAEAAPNVTPIPEDFRAVPLTDEQSVPSLFSALEDPFSTEPEAGSKTGAQTALSARILSPPQENADKAVRAPDVGSFFSNLKRVAAELANPFPLNFAVAAGFSSVVSTLFLGGWLIIVALKLFSIVLRVAQIQRLKKESAPASREQQSLFRNLRQQLAITRKVELKVSTSHRSAMVLGFLHPVIVIPADEGLSDLEPVLRHELAHVRRLDDWINLIQHLIQALLFFHPAVWWVSKRLSLEREIACDDYVLQQCERPRAYALLLANLAGRAQKSLPLLAPGASANKSQLEQRIDMILNTDRNRSPRLAKARLGLITCAAGLVAIAAIYGAPRIVLAQTPPPPEPPAAPAIPTQEAPDFNLTPRALPPDVPSGPKLKPGNHVPVNSRPAIIAVPDVPSAPPVVALAPVPSVTPPPAVAVIPAAPMAAVVAATPRPPTVAMAQAMPAPVAGPGPRPRSKDMSLEERLDRLEKMVESLMNQQRNRSGNFDFHWQGPGEKGEWMDRKELARIEEQARGQADMARKQAEIAREQAEVARHHWAANEKEMESMRENAKREAAQAVDQAKRAMKDKEWALKEDGKPKGPKELKDSTDGPRRELDQMRKQHDLLQQEIRKLEREIRQLERDRKQLDERRSEDEPSGDNQPLRKK